MLFVPKKWWHYVECVEKSVSINTWIPLVWSKHCLHHTHTHNTRTHQPSDARERLKEAIVRTIVSDQLPTDTRSSQTNSEYPPQWVNPNEVCKKNAKFFYSNFSLQEVFSHPVNLELVSKMLVECEATPTWKPRPLPIISHYDWVNMLASESVVEAMSNVLLETHR